MKQQVNDAGVQMNLMFWFHLLITILAWVGMFLFSWYIFVPVLLLVQLQYIVLGECVLNKHHDLDESDNYTFYAFLFESLGFQPNRKRLKSIIRGGLYVAIAALTFVYQYVLGNEALLF